MTTPLARRLAEEIAASGPMPVARYMALCLGDPEHGYYTTRVPFGRDGDFVTAPEVSQLFGELVGAWLLTVWEQLGSPDPVRLVELGPGRGTLMADILRVARLRPAFLEAVSVDLVETSPRLRALQKETLRACPVPVAWRNAIDEVPPGPLLVVANEFFDALPIRQFVRTGDRWQERVVGLDAAGGLGFGLAPYAQDAAIPPGLDAQDGAVVEWCPAADAIMAAVSERIVAEGGAALAIDYGYQGPAFGDTLQAVRDHAYTGLLEAPGESDLTAHVDFATLARSARTAGAAIHGPLTQGEFLVALGLVDRAQRLAAGTDETGFREIEAAVRRLADVTEMGELFKVLAVTSPGVAPPAFPARPR
ncbi:class I SAM-dependent methyltransferase [Amorphus orientalis]|uniref:SAM-dependent MidA family methyltransferase n=1 Tax=Amorphus orientalis TaxID=649198 RepID=A0AAE3VLK3_9HYPH|nr:class I SAM-dependent methyltransferase [Amorphus orientalis]MDQ0314227.1 SAM-dependent MidA family methyltransferase [Amorphus orientalis]